VGALAVGRLRSAAAAAAAGGALDWRTLEAVTLDARGTLLELVDPLPALGAALRRHGVERGARELAAAFRAELRHYEPRAAQPRSTAELRALQRDCTAVFLESLGAKLDPAEFAPAFIAALRFRPLVGVDLALARLRERGLRLAVVSNWDIGLSAHLAAAGLDSFFTVVIAAAGKPDPTALLEALEAMETSAARALHVGDTESDELAARRAGMQFARGPLAGLA